MNREDKGVPVSVAAARLGISEKTLLRRIKAGLINAEKQPLPAGGTAWRVHLEPDSAPEPEETRTGTAPEHHSSVEEGAPDTQRTNAPEVSDTRAGTAMDSVKDTGEAAFLAHVLEENRFLRTALEQRDRDAAELRAALREALRSMPRQLPTNTSETAPEAPLRVYPANTTQAAQNAPEVAQNAKGAAPQREPRPLWKIVLGLR